jgi:hypothetical protein
MLGIGGAWRYLLALLSDAIDPPKSRSSFGGCAFLPPGGAPRRTVERKWLMPSFSGREVRILALAGGLAGILGVFAPAPVFAGDDGQAPLWSGLGGMIGLTGKDPPPHIDYRERARLVLPPKMDLPPPQPPAAQRTAGWPVDPEVVKARKAAQDKLDELRAQSDIAAIRSGHWVSPDKLRPDGPANAKTASATSRCDSGLDRRHCNWVPFRNVFQSIGLAKPDEIVAGQEPDRDWLTDPPKGYRLPTSTTVATQDNSKPAPDPHDSKALLYNPPEE